MVALTIQHENFVKMVIRMKNRQFTNEETVTLQSIVSVNGTSRMEVLKGLKAHSNTFRGHPGAILGHAIKAGLIKKEIVGSDVIYYFVNNNKGGETMEKNQCNKFELQQGNKICNSLINKGVSKGTPEALLKAIKECGHRCNPVTIKFLTNKGFFVKKGDILLVKGLQ